MFEGLVGGMLLGTVTSQMLLDLCLVLSWFYLLYRKFGPGKNSAPTAPFFQLIGIEWAVLGYLVIAVLSLALNAPEPKPWFYALRKFTWIADLYLMTWLFSNARIKARSALIFFCMAFLLPNLYAIYGFIAGVDPITGNQVLRIVGLVNSATYHAHGNGAVLVFFLTLLTLFTPQLPRRLQFGAWTAMLLMSISLLLTYTRGIWISVTIASLFLFLSLGRRYAMIGISVVMGGVLTLFALLPSIQNRVIDTFNVAHGDQVRKNLYKVFWEMIKDHPLIGIGYWDQYRQIETYWPRIGLPANYFTSHAHNQYLNVLGTTGVLGLFFFLSIVIYFLSLNISLYRKSTGFAKRAFLLALLVVQIEYYVACVTDVTFEYAKLRAIMLLTWAFLIAIRRDRVVLES
ncbi:MAG: O-antigen ligase family protein [Bdellovibrionaceae bacterium]|nr:O-antigen ligase family protein [Pseudobdellovibrionaceae bacterium]